MGVTSNQRLLCAVVSGLALFLGATEAKAAAITNLADPGFENLAVGATLEPNDPYGNDTSGDWASVDFGSSPAVTITGTAADVHSGTKAAQLTGNPGFLFQFYSPTTAGGTPISLTGATVDYSYYVKYDGSTPTDNYSIQFSARDSGNLHYETPANFGNTVTAASLIGAGYVEETGSFVVSATATDGSGGTAGATNLFAVVNDGTGVFNLDDFTYSVQTPTTIPEPTSLGLVGLVGGPLIGRRRRARSRSAW